MHSVFRIGALAYVALASAALGAAPPAPAQPKFFPLKPPDGASGKGAIIKGQRFIPLSTGKSVQRLPLPSSSEGANPPPVPDSSLQDQDIVDIFGH